MKTPGDDRQAEQVVQSASRLSLADRTEQEAAGRIMTRRELMALVNRLDATIGDA